MLCATGKQFLAGSDIYCHDHVGSGLVGFWDPRLRGDDEVVGRGDGEIRNEDDEVRSEDRELGGDDDKAGWNVAKCVTFWSQTTARTAHLALKLLYLKSGIRHSALRRTGRTSMGLSYRVKTVL